MAEAVKHIRKLHCSAWCIIQAFKGLLCFLSLKIPASTALRLERTWFPFIDVLIIWEDSDTLSCFRTLYMKLMAMW